MSYRQHINPETEKNILQDSDANYERAEMNLLRDSLSKSYTERFQTFTRLYKLQQMLSKAKITHKPFIEKP